MPAQAAEKRPTEVLRRLEQAIAGPEKAIEAIVQRVQLAIRAIERVLDMGLGLDLGR